MDDREKPQPSKGLVKVLHVHEDAMILAELFRNGSFQDSSQAPYDSWGPHTRVTSVASYRRDPVSQTRPQSLVLAPTCTCEDTDRQESGMARAQRSQEMGAVPQFREVFACTHEVPAGTSRLSSGARPTRCPPIVTVEEPSCKRTEASDGGW